RGRIGRWDSAGKCVPCHEYRRGIAASLAAGAVMQRILNYIDGQFVEPTAGNFLDDVEPATGQLVARVPDSDERDVERAVAAAERAFGDWSATPTEQRSRVLLKISDLIEANLEKLARAESIDVGKPIALARSVDITRAVANFRFFATAVLHTSS